MCFCLSLMIQLLRMDHCCSFSQVRPVAEEEMFKVLHSGKRKKKAWKRMVTKVTFVGPSFTRKPPKYERFIRPSGELNYANYNYQTP